MDLKHDFEQTALTRLHEDFPVLRDLQGSVIFRADDKSAKPSYVAWVFNENTEAYLTELGIKARVTQLIEALIVNRLKNTVLPVYEGVIEFMQGQFMIEWRA
jgi:hypothetical protein